jgi:Transposase DDE domain
VLCKQGSWEPAGRRCATGQLRGRCTTAARGRVIVLHPHHTLLGAARALAATDAFSCTYRCHRPTAERSIAWLVQGTNRPLRYRGTARNRLWLGHRVAAVNLQRLVNLGLTHRADRWAVT